MVISNGGRVVVTRGMLGGSAFGSGNSVLGTGSNSPWRNHPARHIGRVSVNNKLTIRNGGRVYSGRANIGVWDWATNNSVLVTDSGTVWDDSATASDIVFGWLGSWNSLVISNSAQVLGYYAYLGRMS